MIRNVRIENFKSVQELELELGRVNVFIGENGCGKSNILEAIVFAAAASQDKLGNEFLATRGIRVTEPRFMRSAFDPGRADSPVEIRLTGTNDFRFESTLEPKTSTVHPQWEDLALDQAMAARDGHMETLLSEMVEAVYRGDERAHDAIRAQMHHLQTLDLRASFEFIIYSPENSALRTFQREGQILPLGLCGEGLFAHLKALNAAKLDEIAARLSLIDWFEGLEIPEHLAPFESTIRIRDQYLTEGAVFDQRSANEGFLFLLFYFTLLISPDTPKFFAIDNLDASLNPKLCSALTRQIAELSEKHEKQVILTTHNPAVLDGIDLNDDEQRLFVISRNRHGHTKASRIGPPKPLGDDLPLKLSEAFLRGYLGGLPKNF